MAQVNMHEAKSRLSSLIERAEAGEEIVIARAGKPAVKLVPVGEELKPREFGQDAGKIWIADDFDEPDEELIDSFYNSVLFPPDRT